MKFRVKELFFFSEIYTNYDFLKFRSFFYFSWIGWFFLHIRVFVDLFKYDLTEEFK